MAMPTGRRLRAIMISLELHNVLVLGREVLSRLLWQFLHIHAQLFLAHRCFTSIENLKPCILDLSPISGAYHYSYIVNLQTNPHWDYPDFVFDFP
jgi:hypothetical protein